MISRPVVRLLSLFFFLLSGGVSLYAQGTQIPFGQNRVQYKEFTWQYYESEHFKIYFNQGGQNLGRFTAQMAETDLEAIQNMLDYKLNAQPEIIVYNNISDYNQSNFAIGNETVYNTGGRTKIIGNKLFVYFDGNHQNLRIQIREGVGKILINNMVFGGNLQEIVQNAVLLNLPAWFVDGLVSYLGEEWNSELDNQLRDGILSGRYKEFSKLTGDDARFAGHSLWYFIADKYGASNIPNLLYLIRINRSLESGFLFVLGTTVNQTVDEWYKYYYERYTSEQAGKQLPEMDSPVNRKTRKGRIYHSPVISPDGKSLAYVSDDMGKFRIHFEATQEVKTKVVKKGGMKTRTRATDLSYPLVAWSPDGQLLAAIYEKRDKTMLFTYNVRENKKEVKDISRFQRVLSMSFGKNNNMLVLSVMNNGQSDIYTYFINNARVEQITNDYYDDLSASFIKTDNGYEGILFTSNRDSKNLVRTRNIDSILPVGNNDIFFYNYSTKSNTLVKVTQTRNISERAPLQYSDGHFAFLSDYNGISNRFIGYLDTIYDYTKTVVFFNDSTVVNPTFDISEIYLRADFDSIKYIPVFRDTAYTWPVTNYASNILSYDVALKAGKVIQVFQQEKGNNFFIDKVPSNLDESEKVRLQKTGYRQYEEQKKEQEILQQITTIPTITENLPIDDAGDTDARSDSLRNAILEGMYFQTPYIVPEETEAVEEETVTLEAADLKDKNNLITDGKFQPSRIQAYRLKFSNEYVLTQLDNSLLVNPYENFNASGGTFSNPPLSGLFTVSISDLFEDYRFIGGFRFPTSFTGGEYFLKYEDLSKRLDKSLTWYYQHQREEYSFQPVWFPTVEGAPKTNIVEAAVKYPFDVIRSLRLSTSYRSDKIIFLAGDTFSLNQPSYSEDWMSVRLEYVHDNTFPVMTNILNGMRYKVWVELHKQFELGVEDGLTLSLNDGYLGVLGFDFRHYQKVHRQIVWANRVAGGVSFGNQRLIYYLGGVDSWLFPEFNQDTEINEDINYAFQTQATPVRGYIQNIRNGNAYAVFNSELRVPVFTYLLSKPMKSELLRNFQVVGFFDAGTAWEGLSPFEQDNPYNTVTVGQPPLSVDVNFFRDPVVAGLGWGVRTTIFGYFIRIDRARGLELNGLTDPRWYFSLSLDF